MLSLRLPNGRRDKETIETFSHHLQNVFVLNALEMYFEEEAEVRRNLSSPQSTNETINKFKIRKDTLKEINHKKSPEYDLITETVLAQTSDKFVADL